MIRWRTKAEILRDIEEDRIGGPYPSISPARFWGHVLHETANEVPLTTHQATPARPAYRGETAVAAVWGAERKGRLIMARLHGHNLRAGFGRRPPPPA